MAMEDKAGEVVLVTHDDLIDSHGELLAKQHFSAMSAVEGQLLDPFVFESQHVAPLLRASTLLLF